NKAARQAKCALASAANPSLFEILSRLLSDAQLLQQAVCHGGAFLVECKKSIHAAVFIRAAGLAKLPLEIRRCCYAVH
ncbi:MAG: hypothetical protein K1W21_00665, partial [Oscillospiraceae bacterium]